MGTYEIGHLLEWCKRTYDGDDAVAAFDIIYRFLCPLSGRELAYYLALDWPCVLKAAQQVKRK